MNNKQGITKSKLFKKEIGNYRMKSPYYQTDRDPKAPLTPKVPQTQNKKQKFFPSKIARHCSQQYIFKINEDPKYEQGLDIQEQDYTCYQKIQSNDILSISNKSPNNSKLKQTTSTASRQIMFKSNKVSKKCLPAFVKKMSDKKQYPKINGINKVQIKGFQIIKKLGQGKFGTVLLVKDKITGFVLALKIIEKKRIIQSKFIHQFTRELKIQAYLNHPNIIKVYGFFSDEKYFYTLLQFGCDGQLYDLMTKNVKFSEQAISYIVKSLLDSVNYIHSLNILHRDIKPENIVLVHGTVKLCDFGWAVNKQSKYELRETFCGTPLYLSPEILIGAKYDQKVDLWAIGVLCFELLTNSSPFQIQSKQELHRIITSQIIYPEGVEINKEYKEFIESILKKNPIQRMNGKQLIKMKFIKMYQGFETCELLCQ